MAGASGLEVGEISNEMILKSAREEGRKAGDEGVPTEDEIAVDPKQVAAGEEDDKDAKQETAEEKTAREKAEAEAEVYIPEEPKPKEVAKVDPAKTEDEADPDETAAFAKELKTEGYDDDTIKMMLKAVKLGGDIALKRVQAAAAEAKTKEDEITVAQTAERAEYRRKEFVAVGTLQKDGRIPKVPVDVQKKLAEGTSLSEEETKLPGVQRQFAVWNHMAKENRAAIDRGEAPYLTTFRAALDSFEAKEVRDGKVAAAKTESEQRHKVAKKLEVGSSGGDGASKKPMYIRGEGLDSVAQRIINEYKAT